MSSPRGLNKELLDQVKVGCERDRCFEDPIALDARLNLGMGLKLQPESSLELGDPVLICEVGQKGGWESLRGLIEDVVLDLGLDVSHGPPGDSVKEISGPHLPLGNQEQGWKLPSSRIEGSTSEIFLLFLTWYPKMASSGNSWRGLAPYSYKCPTR